MQIKETSGLGEHVKTARPHLPQQKLFKNSDFSHDPDQRRAKLLRPEPCTSYTNAEEEKSDRDDINGRGHLPDR